jgi:hypothetical protein
MKAPDIPDLTFADLARAEPLHGGLEMAIKALSPRPGKGFCANDLWYGAFKPVLLRAVGTHRGYLPDPAIDPDTLPRFVELDDLLSKPDPPRSDATGNRWEQVLRTSDAYDMAYDHLYALLPDCSRCNCL